MYENGDREKLIVQMKEEWASSPRWAGIRRPYSPEDVLRLRPSIHIEQSLARAGAERLWRLLTTQPYVNTFGAVTGSQAVQMVRAGLQAIYMSGWQIAADANLANQTYPDQSLYPCNSVPNAVRRINNALMRADQVERAEGSEIASSRQPAAGGPEMLPAAGRLPPAIYWYAPIVADAEAGFGGTLHTFELMKAMIEAGAAGVHFEDQLASEKKCGHMGGKVIVPTAQFERTLVAARLATDVMDVPTLLFARTDANSATLLTSDVDERDHRFLTGERTAEGFHRVRGGLEAAIARGLAYAAYADLIWCETSTPDLDEARQFAEAIHAEYPGKMLAYNCSPSFNWQRHLDEGTIARFQRELGAMGYAFQFITLAGWHSISMETFQLARDYSERGMSAYVALQKREFEAEPLGYTATKHQREVGAGYYDSVLMTISGGLASTTALAGSTEQMQFH